MKYYCPLSSKDFTLENILSSESISPLFFYKERGFGFKSFYFIEGFSHPDAIIFFERPPIYDFDKGSTDAIKFVLEIDTVGLDPKAMINIGSGVMAYTKTIYLNKNNFNLFFFSEPEKTLTILNAMRAASTKGIIKYQHNFKLLMQGGSRTFTDYSISSIQVNTYHQSLDIIRDRQLNFYKGFIYGVAIGAIMNKSKKDMEFVDSYRKTLNAYVVLKNRVDEKSRIEKGKELMETGYSTDIKPFIQKFNIALTNLKSLSDIIFPQRNVPIESLAQYLLDYHSKAYRTKEEAILAIERRKSDDEIDNTHQLQNLINAYRRVKGDDTQLPFRAIINHTAIILNSNASSAQKEDSNEKIKADLSKIWDKYETEFLLTASKKQVNLDGISYDLQSNKIRIAPNFYGLNPKDLKEYLNIINSILDNPKVFKTETDKEHQLELVETVGNNVKVGSGKQTALYKYLTNQTKDYNFDKQSLVSKNFVAFVFNMDSSEKLIDYLNSKRVESSWIAISFWCTFNGFAKISKHLAAPIFDMNNEFMQNYMDNFLNLHFYTQAAKTPYPQRKDEPISKKTKTPTKEDKKTSRADSKTKKGQMTNITNDLFEGKKD